MIDERFSADAFSRLEPDTPAAVQLARQLNEEVAAELGVATEAIVRRVVEQLRGMGHELWEWERDREPVATTCWDRYGFAPIRLHLGGEGLWLNITFTTDAQFTRCVGETALVGGAAATSEESESTPDGTAPA